MFHSRRLGPSALLVCVLATAAPIGSYAQASSGSSAASSPSSSSPVAIAETSTSQAAQPQPGTVAVPPAKTEAGPGQPIEDKRAFGVLPNYKTAEESAVFVPLTTKAKFVIATKDSFDYPVFITTAFFAGLSQAEGTNNSLYGQGIEGFAHRYGIQYADQTIGNYFPEAIVPTLFHDDPRYFRRSEGAVHTRLLYALSRMFVCRNNNGNWTFNSPEIVGNIMAATAASSYHPHQRTTGDIAEEAGNFWESDVVGNIIKEFWPDAKRHFEKHNKDAPLATGSASSF
jgi:hypothetical protein